MPDKQDYSMKLKLNNPLAVFDLETTGIDVTQDRIVQIAILKVLPDGSTIKFESLVNPGIPIPAFSSEIHGIYDKDIADKPSFKEIGDELIRFLDNCDLAGYNSNKFDIPLLFEEFYRHNFSFNLDNRKFIDVQNIFHKMEKRTLKGAFKFYTGEVMENAHNAMADVEATYKILLAQINRYEGCQYHSEEESQLTPIVNDVQSLSTFSTMRKTLDYAGRIALNDENIPVFNFGKHKNVPVTEVRAKDPSYISWMKKGKFPRHTIMVLEKLWKDEDV